MLYVRSKQDRLAYTAAKGGAKIPHDVYVGVQLTPYIQRLLHVHGDIEQRPEPKEVTPEPRINELKSKPNKAVSAVTVEE